MAQAQAAFHLTRCVGASQRRPQQPRQEEEQALRRRVMLRRLHHRVHDVHEDSRCAVELRLEVALRPDAVIGDEGLKEA
jgi:hypothetical protein